VRIAHLKPHPLNGFICTTILFFLPVALLGLFLWHGCGARCAPYKLHSSITKLGGCYLLRVTLQLIDRPFIRADL